MVTVLFFLKSVEEGKKDEKRYEPSQK